MMTESAGPAGARTARAPRRPGGLGVRRRPRGSRAGALGTAGARQWAHSGLRRAGVEKLRGGRWRAGAAAALFAFQ